MSQKYFSECSLQQQTSKKRQFSLFVPNCVQFHFRSYTWTAEIGHRASSEEARVVAWNSGESSDGFHIDLNNRTKVHWRQWSMFKLVMHTSSSHVNKHRFQELDLKREIPMSNSLEFIYFEFVYFRLRIFVCFCGPKKTASWLFLPVTFRSSFLPHSPS